MSAKQLYRVEVATDYSTVPIGTMHTWYFGVALADGTPITPRQFAVSGTMPGHGHGMTTFPKSKTLETVGRVEVNGMKFHMSGDWTIHVNILGERGTDVVDLKVSLLPPPTKQTTALFSSQELAVLKTLWIDSLPVFDGDPSNRFSGNTQAIELGKMLFFDPGLSATGTVMCATCHQAETFFTDNRAKSTGTAQTPRHAPTLIGAAYSNWFYWDGRRDSLWAQALTPLETIGEMDNTRVDVARYVLSHDNYSSPFKQLTGHNIDSLARVPDIRGIGPLADEEGQNQWRKLDAPSRERINSAFADIGKMLAAYEETLLPIPSLFDQFVTALFNQGEAPAQKIFTAQQIRGLKLFIDGNVTACLRCHNGPMFTNQEFHNIATATSVDGSYDSGRGSGLSLVRSDPFNCIGRFSDALAHQCLTLTTVRPDHLDPGAFKTPTLRNVSQTAPYMHHGEIPSLELVLHHYRFPPQGPPDSHEIPELKLDNKQTRDLIEFLKTL